MKREEIKKQWELEFGAKYEDYQRANVYTAVDILDFAESVVNKLLISGVGHRRRLLFSFGKYLEEHNVTDFTPQMHIDDFLSKQ